MKDLLSSPLFVLLLTLGMYLLSQYIHKKTKIVWLNPLLLSMIFIILSLIILNIPLDKYNDGTYLISFFLTPSTVILALPLYKKFDLLKKNAIPIIIGITVGSFVGMCSILILCKLFNVDSNIALSLIPKSVTTPIGVEVAKQLGGLPPITISAIIITGIMGAIFSPIICKLFKIEHNIAVGVAIGTSSHALGTTKALELGETEGAMSSLSIGVAGLITVLLSPLVVKLFSMLL